MSFVVTGRVRRVFARADAEARAHGHPYLAPEHILMSLTGRPDPQIATVLFNLGISGTRLRQTVSDLIGAAHGPAPAGRLTWTPEAVDAVAQARAEVRREVAKLPVPLRQRIPWRWRTCRPRRPRLRRR